MYDLNQRMSLLTPRPQGRVPLLAELLSPEQYDAVVLLMLVRLQPLWTCFAAASGTPLNSTCELRHHSAACMHHRTLHLTK